MIIKGVVNTIFIINVKVIHLTIVRAPYADGILEFIVFIDFHYMAVSLTTIDIVLVMSQSKIEALNTIDVVASCTSHILCCFVNMIDFISQKCVRVQCE